MDLSDTVKNGMLYMQEAGEELWKPHFFVLTSKQMVYTELAGLYFVDGSAFLAGGDREILVETLIF